ncbi:energy transducer TonB [Flectobacillus sp. BAB-3569]|uniref:energy transducer TonB n=1 Tax=Flectobacillus sp. BAB-3569 TaxID=1509483 RepID=UPI000BA33B43|nr:energy transducer TonB [Flectobacillus sp. BAB-3569]PAC32215.1 energy transducer TonB [Flectobacillus sp. BAB-3569]
MNSNSSNQQHETLDDIIFEGRNKLYGAYFLRQEYKQIVKRATLIGVGAFGLALSTPFIWASQNSRDKREVEITLQDVKLPPAEEKKIELPEPPKPETPVEPVKQIKYLAPEIVTDEREIELPPTQEELAESKAVIGTENVDGAEIEIPPVDPDLANTKPAIEAPVHVEKTEESIFTTVEKMPEYKGGIRALGEYLNKNLKFPSQAQRAGVGGKVFVSFVVMGDGSISQLSVSKGIGFGCDEEALRVVSKMPNWIPGKQSGRPVSVRFTLPITFQIMEE